MPNEHLETLFKTWLQEHGGIVLKVARAYTLSKEEGEDLAQEILLQIWRSLSKFEGRASAHTWFYRVALNTALGWHRNERRRRERQQPLQEMAEVPMTGQDTVQQLQQRETVKQLYVAIQQLQCILVVPAAARDRDPGLLRPGRMAGARRRVDDRPRLRRTRRGGMHRSRWRLLAQPKRRPV